MKDPEGAALGGAAVARCAPCPAAPERWRTGMVDVVSVDDEDRAARTEPVCPLYLPSLLDSWGPRKMGRGRPDA